MGRDDLEGDPWATTSARRDAFAELHDEGALDELPCLACGYPTLTERGGYHICVVCHWEDDGSTPDDPDHPSAVNHGLSLRQSATHVVATGVFAAPHWEPRGSLSTSLPRSGQPAPTWSRRTSGCW